MTLHHSLSYEQLINKVLPHCPINILQYELFCLYFELLSKWGQVHNLVQKETLFQFFERHVLNSLELSPFLSKEKHLVDIGAGAGFPGLALSIMGYEFLTLVEASHKKCSFLRSAVSALSLNAQVVNQRVEKMSFDTETIICRAFAPLERLFSWVHAQRFVLLKGQNYSEEIKEAQKQWKFTFEAHQGLFSPTTYILTITHLSKH